MRGGAEAVVTGVSQRGTTTIDTFSLIGADGHSYNYLVMSENVASPSYWNIYGLAAPYGPVTAQLVGDGDDVDGGEGAVQGPGGGHHVVDGHAGGGNEGA